MGRTPQETLAIDERRQQVAALYRQLYSQAEIASRLGVSQATISSDLRAIRRQWRESAERDFGEAVHLQWAKLDYLEHEAWVAWQRSQEPQVTTRVNSDGSNKRGEKLTRTRPGDPKYLEIIRRCNADRRALLGLEAPIRIAPTSPDGERPYNPQEAEQIVALLSDDELALLHKVYWRMQEIATSNGQSKN